MPKPDNQLIFRRRDDEEELLGWLEAKQGIFSHFRGVVSEWFQVASGGVGWFQTNLKVVSEWWQVVSSSFRWLQMVSDGFEWFQAGVGWFQIGFGWFQTGVRWFRVVSDFQAPSPKIQTDFLSTRWCVR